MVERLAGHEAHALDGFFLGDDAGHRRAESHRPLRLAGFGQGLDLFFRDVPVLQPQQAGIGQLLHAVPRWSTGFLQRFDALGGNRVFALGGNQFRAVHLEQRLPLADRLAGHIDMQALDIALELGRNRIHAAFIRLDPTGCADHFVEGAQLRGFGPHAQFLYLLGTDLDLIGGRRLVVRLTFIDGDVVHPHRIFLGRRRGVGQPHRIAVEEQLLFFFGRLRGSGCRRCCRFTV